ncbi:MAG: hypothetical protein CL864_05005 [Cyanobium sp. SAT1300]|nr:hypothetical protein [Cyanobium sp. SAT1300]
MAILHLQSMRWTSDGELDDADRLILLNTLIPQCIPSVQTELIQVVERLALSQSTLTPQVCES